MSDVTDTSKALSWLLRHGAADVGIAMDPAGWVAVDDVVRHLRISEDQLDQAIRLNTKARLQRDGDRVRACQGHNRALPVTQEALEATWEDISHRQESVWHGTRADVLEEIGRYGIQPMARTHVHLADAPDSVVGKRANVAVLLEIDPAAMRERGIRLFRSDNGVILAREVPALCIVGLLPMSRAARLEQKRLRALLGLSTL